MQTKRKILSLRDNSILQKTDFIAVEEPLEIRLKTREHEKTIAITMRTPGNDHELVAGFLFCENVINDRHDIDQLRYCTDQTQNYNQILAMLRRNDLDDLPQLDRHFFTSSACGVCGTTMIINVKEKVTIRNVTKPIINRNIIENLSDKLRSSQKIFDRTGGLHAAALFDLNGDLITVREDVGRHNAMDKLIGHGLINDRLPFREKIVMVSGRASYELIQKCAMAGAEIFCAISAPSSLAVDLAREIGITLIGFLRENRFNIYAHHERIQC